MSEQDEESGNYSLSAYLIAQLGKNFKDGVNEKISGEQLLGLAIEKIKELQYMAGGMVIFLETENEEKLIRFYEDKNGFKRFERQRKKGAASLRIYILVCLGAALVMMTNQYIQVKYNIIGDPSRMGTQVVNGIGFLGAGSIIVTGFYEGAVLGAVVIFLVASTLTSVDKLINKNSSYLEVYIEYKTEKYAFSDYIEHIREQRPYRIYPYFIKLQEMQPSGDDRCSSG